MLLSIIPHQPRKINPSKQKAGDKEIKEAEEYLHSFYECCLKYADIVAAKYKTPFLPKGEDAQKEISEYESECRKQYPEIDAEKIKGVFSTVCWLANR